MSGPFLLPDDETGGDKQWRCQRTEDANEKQHDVLRRDHGNEGSGRMFVLSGADAAHAVRLYSHCQKPDNEKIHDKTPILQLVKTVKLSPPTTAKQIQYALVIALQRHHTPFFFRTPPLADRHTCWEIIFRGHVWEIIFRREDYNSEEKSCTQIQTIAKPSKHLS